MKKILVAGLSLSRWTGNSFNDERGIREEFREVAMYNVAWRFGIGTLRFSALRAILRTVDLIFEKNLSRWTTA